MLLMRHSWKDCRGINKEILRIAGPSILANITVPLVGMVDTIVAGHLGGEAATLIGGIAVGSMLFDLLYWNFGFLRVTTGGMTAQAYGRWSGEGFCSYARECADTLVRSLTIALASALLLIAVQWWFVDLAFLVVKCSDEVQELARQYFRIRIWAAPATLSLMAFKGWFIGMQDSISAMVTDLVVNVINIAASFTLALGIGGWSGLGYQGIALGTVLAQYSGLVCSTAILLIKYHRTVTPALHINGVLSGPKMHSMFSMNKDIFIRSLCFIAIYIGYTILSAKFGDVLLASCSIMMKLLMIFSYFIDGFAYAGEAMTGKYIGLQDWDGVRKTTVWNFVWCGGIAVMFMFVYGFGGTLMVRLMTSDPTVVDCLRRFILWLMLMPVAGCAAFAWDGIFIGATKSPYIRNAMLLAVLSFFALWIVGGALMGPSASSEAHIHLLMAAYFAHLAARSIYLTSKSKVIYK